MRKITLLSLLFVAFAFVANAQKFGYVNSDEVLAQLPEMKAAESNLTSFQKQQEKLVQDAITRLQERVQMLTQQNQEGLLTPKKIEEEQAALEAEQARIAKMESDASTEFLKRREAELQPIFERVNTAIQEIAEADGYTMVFDSASSSVVLYAVESVNLTDEVIARVVTP